MRNDLLLSGKSAVKITERKFSTTLPIDEDVRTEPSIRISQEPFLLCEADFLRLKYGDSKVLTWAGGVLLTSLGMLFIPIAKYIIAKTAIDKSIIIQSWEWVAPFIGIGIAAILFFIGKMLPNERKQVMSDIEAHFSEAPRTPHIGEQ